MAAITLCKDMTNYQALAAQPEMGSIDAENCLKIQLGNGFGLHRVRLSKKYAVPEPQNGGGCRNQHTHMELLAVSVIALGIQRIHIKHALQIKNCHHGEECNTLCSGKSRL